MTNPGLTQERERSLVLALTSPQPQERAAAARELGLQGVSRAVPALVGLLNDSDRQVSQAAAEALSEIGGREVAVRLVPFLGVEQPGLRNLAMNLLRRLGQDAPDLLLSLLDEGDRDLRIFAADLLGETEAPGVVRALVAALADPDPNLRAAAASSLGRRGDPGAVPALIKALDDDEWVRFAAVEALAQIGELAALKPLLSAFPHSSALMQAAISDALGRLADPRAVPALRQALNQAQGHLINLLVGALLRAGEPGVFLDLPPAIKEKVCLALVDALSDPSDAIKANALEGLAVLGDAGAVYAILDLAGKTDDPEMIGLIEEALADIGATPPLVGAVRDPNPGVARTAAAALGRMGGALAEQALTDALGHSSAEVRLQAAVRLGRMGTPSCLPALQGLLTDPEPRVRIEVARTLGRLGQPEAVPALEVLLDDPQEMVRLQSLRALLDIGGPLALEALGRGLDSSSPWRREVSVSGLAGLGQTQDLANRFLSMLEDAEPKVRRAVVSALAGADGPGVWGGLNSALSDPDAQVRLALVTMLSARDHPAVPGLMARALDDDDPWICYQAVEALGRLQAVEAVPRLMDLLQSSSQALRLRAAQALGEIGDSRANDELMMLLTDADPELRAAATQAMQRIAGGWG